MTDIDGVDVAIWKCDQCGSNNLWLFKGDNGGYKAVCADCNTEDRCLIEELDVSYLWGDKENGD